MNYKLIILHATKNINMGEEIFGDKCEISVIIP